MTCGGDKHPTVHAALERRDYRTSGKCIPVTIGNRPSYIGKRYIVTNQHATPKHAQHKGTKATIPAQIIHNNGWVGKSTSYDERS